MKLLKNVYLIGFMGAGKSTVARKLARICNCESVDLDVYIERMTRMKIKDIFAEYGEETFRKIENDALQKVSDFSRPRFISCGGGVVVTDKNLEIIQTKGFCIHLISDVLTSKERISDISTRPLFSKIDEAHIRFDERLPLYREAADCEVDTHSKNSIQVTREVINVLLSNKILVK